MERNAVPRQANRWALPLLRMQTLDGVLPYTAKKYVNRT